MNFCEKNAIPANVNNGFAPFKKDVNNRDVKKLFVLQANGSRGGFYSGTKFTCEDDSRHGFAGRDRAPAPDGLLRHLCGN
jgi:hypothetical protein